MNYNSNNDFSERIANEMKISDGADAVKWGSTLILALAIFSFVFVTLTAYSMREFLSPIDWVILLSDSIILIFCGMFARKGYTWAFIVPIIIYAIIFIQTIIAGQWMYALIRAVIVVALGVALKKVLDHKRAAKEEAYRQVYQ